MKKEFVSADYTAGQLNAMVKKMIEQAGDDAPERFLRGEIKIAEPARKWEVRDGLIYFTVTSDGTIGKDWIKRLEKKGYRTGDWAKSVLLSPDFQPTTGITSTICVVPGKLFTSDPTTEEIRQELSSRNLKHGKDINAELACLIREKFTDEELEAMGLWWIVVMHEPIKDSVGDPSLLNADRDDFGRRLYAYCDNPGNRWGRHGGFAGVVTQVGAQA